MAKFIITKDFSFGTYVPQGQGRPIQTVNFKKGDIVEGNLIYKYPLQHRQTVKSPDAQDQLVETQTAKGMVRIPFRKSFEVPVDFIIEMPIGKPDMSIPETNIGNEGPALGIAYSRTTETPAKETPDKNWFTTKNIVIGVLVIVGIYVFLKWKKMI
jgi:hypothetical protein